jgi:hypothetical protein
MLVSSPWQLTCQDIIDNIEGIINDYSVLELKCVHAYQCYRRGVAMFTVLSRLYIGCRKNISGHVQPRHNIMGNPQYSTMGVHSSSRALPNLIKLSGWWSGYLA